MGLEFPKQLFVACFFLSHSVSSLPPSYLSHPCLPQGVFSSLPLFHAPPPIPPSLLKPALTSQIPSEPVVWVGSRKDSQMSPVPPTTSLLFLWVILTPPRPMCLSSILTKQGKQHTLSLCTPLCDHDECRCSNMNSPPMHTHLWNLFLYSRFFFSHHWNRSLSPMFSTALAGKLLYF